MSDWTKLGIPNPGSKEATDRGCICAVMDNYHGAGMTAGYGTPEDPAFWITGGCPVHDPQPEVETEEAEV